MRDPATVAVLDALEAAGGKDCARFVGGAVRNTLMGLPVADVDIATTLTPPASIAALEAVKIRVVPTGVEHGTVTAVRDHKPFEITTLRRDVETDGRRAVVAFTKDWAEDAQRRDFRLNALYADRKGRVYDYVGGGVDDARTGRVVFVGDADTRIREDYLRILRFFRFFAWYGEGAPDPEGLAACKRLKAGVAQLSAERVSKELMRLLQAPDPSPAMYFMDASGVLAFAIAAPVDLERFQAMVAIDADPELRLSALLPDSPKTVVEIANGLRLSIAQRDRLEAAAHDIDLDLSPAQARAAIYRMGKQAFSDLVKRAWARTLSMSPQAQGLLDLASSWTPPQFPLGGEDVMALGVAKGPDVGRLLRETEDWWVAHDFPQDGAREKLAALVKAGA